MDVVVRNFLVGHGWRLMPGRNVYRNWYCNSGAFVEKHPAIRGYVKSYIETEDASAAIANLFSGTERLLRAALKTEGVAGKILTATLPPLLKFCVSDEQRFFNLPAMCCDVRSIYCLNSARIGAEHGDHERDLRELRQTGWNPPDPETEYEHIVHQRLLSAHSQLCGIFQQVDPETGLFLRNWAPRTTCKDGSHDGGGRLPDEPSVPGE